MEKRTARPAREGRRGGDGLGETQPTLGFSRVTTCHAIGMERKGRSEKEKVGL